MSLFNFWHSVTHCRRVLEASYQKYRDVSARSDERRDPSPTTKGKGKKSSGIIEQAMTIQHETRAHQLHNVSESLSLTSNTWMVEAQRVLNRFGRYFVSRVCTWCLGVHKVLSCSGPMQERTLQKTTRHILKKMKTSYFHPNFIEHLGTMLCPCT